MKKRICFITGTRAEYGLLKPLIDKIRSDPAFKCNLIATGSHLSPEFGLTRTEIQRDKVPITETIEIVLSSDTPIGICKSMGLTLISIGETYARIKPDLIIVLGDRYEILCAVSAALIHKIPVAHISGGDVTEGAFDDSLRHAITKMSHVHFASTEEYRKRVIQMGEAPELVFNVGALGIDNIKNISLLSKHELAKELSIHFNKHNLLVTFHPVTLENKSTTVHFGNLLDALHGLKDTNMIFTKANSDTGGRSINRMIDHFVAKHPTNSFVFTSMGQKRYLSTMKSVDAVVGNSSSGIVEAPSFKIGTINIGDRQKGRIQARSVINCSPEKDAIAAAIKKAFSAGFKKQLQHIDNPYGMGNASVRIKHILKSLDFSDLIKKQFCDIEFRVKP
jgi:UDP-hydrolysing UDP-N-acetyl-D-glucosamine 2-epimerase